MSTQTYYDILGVAQSADITIIQAAYHAQVNKYRHDPTQAHMLGMVNQAYDVLSNPAKRADYDAWLRVNQSQPATPPYTPPAQVYQMPSEPSYRTPAKTSNSKIVAWLIGLFFVLLTIIVLAYMFLSSVGTFDDDDSVTPINQPAQTTPVTLQEVQPLEPTTPVTIDPPAPVVTVTKEQQTARNQAHAQYLAAVNRINSVWNSLPKSTQNALRAEQRAINAKREADCKAQAASQYTAAIDQEAARYQCEVPRMDARTEELRVYAETIRSQATPAQSNVSDDPVDYLSPSEARALYEASVANINDVWNNLSDDTREALRAEQRAINAEREARCKQYAKDYYNSKNDQTVARYLCEVPELDARAMELSEYY
ncbi:DnaJ domain-containing protein [Moraxella sp. FZLJ2107]|uniref:DnaJ domain-containing protein n=1 Tax=unclassified Moraxella TaxID=2685852 RepID=UPI0020C89182|nr:MULTISPECIES: DnaJ domain-containing protein [unclassified Moraxella]UTO04215.1 DnaJ domain-containing protein [Moraxella sp. FZLJ2107]UTO23048.1 DnaJ domain-containing protein [Moraxella sp. FZLJ2109]